MDRDPFEAQPLKQGPSLASALAARLRQEIGSKRFAVGERFPTDVEIANAFGVSRTVVREAVAALRAEGLVVTRHGRGSVVASTVASHLFGISREDINTLGDVMSVFELRRALECEAVALAAHRRTQNDIATLSDCLHKMDEAIEKGEDGVQEDIELHLNIARATQNDYFPRLLISFSSVLIARQRIRSHLRQPNALRDYLDVVQAQHISIVDAIIAGDPVAASEFMREHLEGSRYRAALQERETLAD